MAAFSGIKKKFLKKFPPDASVPPLAVEAMRGRRSLRSRATPLAVVGKIVELVVDYVVPNWALMF